MKSHQKFRLVTQLLLGQTVLIVIAGITLIGTAMLLAPSIFKRHMLEAGIDSATAQKHMTEAFASAFSLSLSAAMLASFVIAGIIALYLIRRISRPIESLAVAAENLSSVGGSLKVDLGSSTTEIDRLAAALTRMSNDLSRSEEDKARMLRDLAHELRTPISTIGALVDGIEDGVVPGNAHSWNTIRDQLQRLNRLSRDVRDVSHSYDQSLANQKVSVDPKLILSLAISSWAPHFEKKGVILESIMSADMRNIEVDPMRIGQVLSNLLENALRHTTKTGKVELILEYFNGRVHFKVSDNGEGISEDQLPHIFDRLYRGDTARQSGNSGSGLGLTIARSIAESNSGTLVATSKGRGQGSTFIMTLPATD